jgi:hypothetical protein
MTVLVTDLVYTFSGGSSNSNPDESLGGDPSIQPILSQRLFSDVSTSQAADGIIDYRCIYLHNANSFDTLFNTQLFVVYTVPGEVTVDLGFYIANERQVMSVLNYVSITSGSFVVTYTDTSGGHDLTVNWDSNPGNWASNFQTALRTVSNLENVTVNANVSLENLTFEIDFVGAAANRAHDLIVLKTNSLSPTTTVGITRSVGGGPTNSIADEIDFATTTPNSPIFTGTSIEAPVVIGDFRPLDAVPIWIRRTVPAGTAPIPNDGFTIRVAGNPVV